MGFTARFWSCRMCSGGGGCEFGRRATLQSRSQLPMRPRTVLAEPPAKKSPSNNIIRVAPSLMLPPALDESGDMVYQLYSLAEERVSRVNKGRSGGESESESESNFPYKLVGSSHGWLALFNPRNNDLFLSNPITGKTINLPPIHKLPDPRFNMIGGRGNVSKVSLSCSPEKPECRAMMTFGPADRLAFCVPGRSREWTPIGDLFFIEVGYPDYQEKYLPSIARVYEDFVYRGGRDVFTGVTGMLEYEMESLMDVDISCITKREDWDIVNPTSPKIVYHAELKTWVDNSRTPSWLFDQKEFLEKRCIQIPQLVYSEHLDRLFLVLRFVLPRVGPNGEAEGRFPLDEESMRGLLDIYPRKTVNFLVLEISSRSGGMRIVHSLDGLAMFVGGGDSAVVSASEFPGLKPNCIYFADAKRYSRSPFERPSFGNHDVGIFDYGKKTVSPIQVFEGIESPIVWFFTPSHGFCC